jgi:hypothetical protein
MKAIENVTFKQERMSLGCLPTALVVHQGQGWIEAGDQRKWVDANSLILIDGCDELLMEPALGLQLEKHIIGTQPSSTADALVRVVDRRVLAQSAQWSPRLALGKLGMWSLALNGSKGTGLEALEAVPVAIPEDGSVYDLVIVGAGPSGASLAAYAQAMELDYLWVGEPFSFWLYHILPRDLRSPAPASGITTPRAGLDFQSFAQKFDIAVNQPVSMPAALAYFNYFMQAQRLHPHPLLVEEVSYQEVHYSVQLRVGDQQRRVTSRNLAWCTGLKGMENIPAELRHVPSKNILHASDLALPNIAIKGYKIAVLGAGQSAAEHAVAAAAQGADVKLLLRDSEVTYRNLHSPGHRLYKWCAKNADWLGHRLPTRLQHKLLVFLLKGTVEPRMKQDPAFNALPLVPNFKLKEAKVLSDGRLELRAKKGQCELVDLLILGTGYHYQIDKVQPLKRLHRHIHSQDGFPVLDEHCMSSMPGLFFGGYAAMQRIGPKCQFIAGSVLTSQKLMDGVTRRLTHDD